MRKWGRGRTQSPRSASAVDRRKSKYDQSTNDERIWRVECFRSFAFQKDFNYSKNLIESFGTQWCIASVLTSGRKKSFTKSSLLQILLQDPLACFWLGGYFYPRLLIGRIFFIRGFWLGGCLSGCQCQPRHITARFAPNRPGIFALIPSPQGTSISLGEFKSSRSFQ